MMDYTWIINPYGMEMEVDTKRVPELLLQGYRVRKEQVNPEIQKIAADCQLVTLNYFPYEGYGRVKDLFTKYIAFKDNHPIKFVLGYPHYVALKPKEKLIFYTMFEASRIPEEWVLPANMATALIVPSQFSKEAFEKAGVKTPIYIVCLGTDEFELYEPTGRPFTFLHYDYTSYAHRKGSDIILDVFVGLFGNMKDKVRLIMKGRKHQESREFQLTEIQAPNIEYIYSNCNRNILNDYLAQTHCFLFPSRGEGFGFPALEAIGHGIPTILTNAHSLADFSDLGMPLGITGKAFAKYDGYHGYGNWVEPDRDQLRILMWEVYQYYAEKKADAVRNRLKAIDRYDFTQIAPVLVETIAKAIKVG